MSPIEMFVAAYGRDAEELLEGLGIERISPDELVLKPALVNMERRTGVLNPSDAPTRWFQGFMGMKWPGHTPFVAQG